MTAQDGAAPGVYSSDQAQARVLREDAEANARRAELAEQDAARYKDDHLRTCVLVAELYEAATGRRGSGPARGVVEDVRQVREERDALRSAYEERGESHARKVRELHRVTEERNRLQVSERMAREQTAELMREVAQLHKALDSLGTSPERLAQQVGAGMAVELFGRVYVVRDVALRDLLRDDEAKTDEALLAALPDSAQGQPLLEADGMVCVPIPKGHMLSVTVTPYDSTPEPDHDSTCRHD